MTKRFFSEILSPIRVGRPIKRLLAEVLKQERKTNRKVTLSDFVRRSLIREARRVLGSKADEILAKGVEVGGKR